MTWKRSWPLPEVEAGSGRDPGRRRSTQPQEMELETSLAAGGTGEAGKERKLLAVLMPMPELEAITPESVAASLVVASEEAFGPTAAEVEGGVVGGAISDVQAIAAWTYSRLIV